MLDDPFLGIGTEQKVSRASVYVHCAHLAQVAQARQRKHDRYAPGDLFAREDQLGVARNQAGAQLGHDLAIHPASGFLSGHVQRGYYVKAQVGSVLFPEWSLYPQVQ